MWIPPMSSVFKEQWESAHSIKLQTEEPMEKFRVKEKANLLRDNHSENLDRTYIGHIWLQALANFPNSPERVHTVTISTCNMRM